jgi:hypothetical protein
MSEDKLHDCHLINNAKYMMKIDCKEVSFPMEIRDDFQLCDSDRFILNKVFAEDTGGIKFLHQTGRLVEYLKQAPEDSDIGLQFTENCVVYCTVMPLRRKLV